MSDPLGSAPPLTLEGSSILHQMYQVHWKTWGALDAAARQKIAGEAAELLGHPKSALVAMLGHKGDLELVHFRDDFEQLHQTQLDVARLSLNEFLTPTSSYVSVVELGLYDSTVKLHQTLAEKNVAPGTPEWEKETAEAMETQRKAMHPRLWPEIPHRRHHCFYPMDKKRSDKDNWYSLPVGKRRDLMREHGMIGRKYAGTVNQIISGSIGFDNWEWGVDLFADDPVVFKKLIYEMRFDEASALYGLFGHFFVGLQFSASELGTFLDGKTPGLR